MNEITQELLRLAQENPDLPVVTLVATECVAGDEWGYWLSALSKCDIREYAVDDWIGNGIIRYKDDKNDEESLIESIAEGKYAGTEADYEKAELEAAELWTKAIVVYVDPH